MLRYAWYYDMFVCYLLQMENILFSVNSQSFTSTAPMTLINSHQNYSNNRFWIWQMFLFDIILTGENKFLDIDFCVNFIDFCYLLMEIKRRLETCLYLGKIFWQANIEFRWPRNSLTENLAIYIDWHKKAKNSQKFIQ